MIKYGVIFPDWMDDHMQWETHLTSYSPMSAVYKSEKNKLASLLHDKQAIDYWFQPTFMKFSNPMESVLEPIHSQQLAISLAAEPSGAVALMNGINSDIFHVWDNLDLATTTSRIVESMSAPQQSWLDCMKLLDHNIFQPPQLQNFTEMVQRDISLQLAATERIMATLDFEAISRHLQIENQVMTGVMSSIAVVTASYGTLTESLLDLPNITQSPALVLPGATREIYTTGFALKTLGTWDERDEEEDDKEIQLVTKAELETSGCIALLQQFDPNLARPYIGARDALNGNNPDRARHFLISLRELWTHLLRHLAPDNLVFTWISENPNQQDLLHKGRPTRRARILYFFRDLNNGPLKEFLLQDTWAFVKLIELFNRIHELESGLTDEELRAIKLRSDSWLMFILQINTMSDAN